MSQELIAHDKCVQIVLMEFKSRNFALKTKKPAQQPVYIQKFIF